MSSALEGGTAAISVVMEDSGMEPVKKRPRE